MHYIWLYAFTALLLVTYWFTQLSIIHNPFPVRKDKVVVVMAY